MTPLKVSKEKMNGSTSGSLYLNGQSSSLESIMSAGGGETSVVATAVIGGMSLNVWCVCVCSLTLLG